MKKAILIRYSEIYLKGKNQSFFQSRLLKNIRKSLSDIDCEVKLQRCRYIVDNYDEEDEFEIVEKLKKIFGIYSFSVATIVNSNFEEIKNAVLKSVDFSGTFKVETNRADKRFPMTSMQVSAELGGLILDNNANLKVDVHNPQNIISVDIRDNGKAFIFNNCIKGSGGLPTGCSGNAVLMLSGGIDSPVAGYMLAKRGLNIQGVYFHSYPYTGDLAKQKVVDLAKLLKDYTGKFTLNVVPFTKIQEAIHEKCPENLMITIMRRIMMRISERIAENNNAKAIITGESLGQVASQTIESINVTNEVVTLPVFRPLIGFDKIDIITISKQIGTYDTSILPYEDCCTVFLPKNPIIRPKREYVLKHESVLDIDSLIEEAIANIEKIEL